jgi:hypothetical protein
MKPGGRFAHDSRDLFAKIIRKAGKMLKRSINPLLPVSVTLGTCAATLLGTARAHDVVPWFWSYQGGMRLQMVGLVPAEGTPGHVTVRRAGPKPDAFSLFHYTNMLDSSFFVLTGQLPCDWRISRWRRNQPAAHQPSVLRGVLVRLQQPQSTKPPRSHDLEGEEDKVHVNAEIFHSESSAYSGRRLARCGSSARGCH